jgi:N-acetylglucosamine-6-phosphate deacetylase
VTGSRLLLQGLGQVDDLDGPSAILVADGRIEALDGDAHAAAEGARVVDAAGLAAAPGFIELQLNGMSGHDFTTAPDAMWLIGEAIAGHGVTSFLPTIVTSPPGTVERALEAWRSKAPEAGTGAVPLGLHVEGPFLSPRRNGAHDPALLREPDLDELRRWSDGDGLRILTIAPELPRALDAIPALAAADVVVSVGHTDADATTVTAAVDAGARYATHLLNAMPPLGHRSPGAAGALLADERVTVGIIVDGRHLDPLIVRTVAGAARGRLSLVSDAIAAVGLTEGRHRLAALDVEVRNGAARLPDGTLAGSVVMLDECVRNLARITGSARLAVGAVTATPARLLGLEDGRGHLRVGGRADVVLLDEKLGVRATLVGGALVHGARSG